MELRIIPNKNSKTFVIENAHVIYRNFAGNEQKYNAKGNRVFSLAFNSPEDDVIVQELIEAGWNIKTKAPRDPADNPWYACQVKVRYHEDERYQHLDPVATLIVGGKKTVLTQDTISCLDSVNIVNADVEISSRPFEMRDGTTVQVLYLKQIYVTGEENYLQSKYADLGGDLDSDENPFA